MASQILGRVTVGHKVGYSKKPVDMQGNEYAVGDKFVKANDKSISICTVTRINEEGAHLC